MTSKSSIEQKLAAFKKKYYIDKALKGGLIWLAILFGSYFLINTLEFNVGFNEIGRTIIFFTFIAGITFAAYSLFIKYLLKLRNQNKQISNEQVAEEVGAFFPEISDKLLNLLQLEKLSESDNELLIASIRQKESQLIDIPFVNAIDLKENKKYIRYLIPPAAAIILALIFLPQLITKSSERIINFNTAYLPEAPFSFEIENKELLAFKNEPYTLYISTLGSSVPESVFLIINGRRIKTRNEGNGQFKYSFDRLIGDVEFILEGASVISSAYSLKVVERPTLTAFSIQLDYPDHTGLENETIQNSGNITIPEGTNVNWTLNTLSTDRASIFINREERQFQNSSDGLLYDSTFINSFDYKVSLYNEYSQNRDSLIFKGKIIKDQYPKVNLEQYQDTVLYREIVLGGQISDDYGFNDLKLRFQYEGEENFRTQKINFERNQNEQTFYHVFKIDSSYVKAGGEIKYYIEVADNDGVNGFKRSKTSTFSFKVPTLEELTAEIEKGNQQVQQEIDNTLNKAKELQKAVEELDERMKTKKELDWRDEKLMNEILKQKEALSKDLEKLREENKKNNTKQQQFEPKSDEIQQKMQQLQEIMNEVLDEETQKLYEELRELLEQNADIEEFRDQVEEMRQNGQNMEKDLERTLELFKKLQFDMKLEENIEQLEKEITDQEQLQEDTEKSNKSNEELAKQQQQELEDLEKLKEELKKLNELNQDRKNPDALPKDLNEDLEDIKEDQEEAKEALEEEKNEEGEKEKGTEEESEKNEQEGEEMPSSKPPSSGKQKASKSQQRASQKMKEVKQSLQSMQNAMEMEQMQEDLGNLRDLVDNLVTLSFNQETLMNDFKDIRQSDPRFVDLSQQQLKLKDDSQIIQDSLISLSQRVFQISSFVMKELNEMNRQMDGSVDALKEKRISQAVGKQQFTMTSINNLALLLDDVLQQMQEQMSGMGNSQSKGQKNMPMGGLTELQQKLSDQIKELKQSGKSGRQLSEELAKLAAQQERIRNALENFETGLDGNKLGDKIDKLIEEMELNEMDLLNKNISNQTIERQRDILTRMLDAENAMEQRGEDEKREAETAYEYELSVPESMLEYLKQKEKEIELLRTIPTKLNPYYKKETNKYFNRIKNKDQF